MRGIRFALPEQKDLGTLPLIEKRQTAETPGPATVTNPFLNHVENDGKATDREDESGRIVCKRTDGMS